MSEEKRPVFCKDCKWIKRETTHFLLFKLPLIDLCSHPKYIAFDPVSGKPSTDKFPACLMKNDDLNCSDFTPIWENET